MQSKQNEKENRAHHRKPSQYSLISNNLQSNINQANTYRDFENSNKNNCYFIKSGQNLNQETNKFVWNKNLQDSPQQNPIITNQNERIEFNCFNDREASPVIEETSPKRDLSQYKEKILKENTDYNNSPTFRESAKPENYDEINMPYKQENMHWNEENLDISAYQNQDDNRRGLLKNRNKCLVIYRIS